MMNKYPMYIVSKGRWDVCLTAKALDKINAEYYIVVEQSDYDKYAEFYSKEKLLVVPQYYHDTYDTFDDLGDSKSKGPGVARNFCWDHSIKLGYDWHWVFDDNIRDFYIYNNNKRIRVGDTTIFRVMEEFCELYENIAQAGPNYRFFVVEKAKYPPFILNTRIYSMLLIRNDIPYRWRGRYNEDTDLSLRILKDGWCTVQFNMFLGDKLWTQTLKGGNMQEFYSKEGTLPKSQMLVNMHPDVTKLVWRFNRWHHYVDYSQFKKNKLKRKNVIPNQKYNLKLIKRENK